MDTIYALASGSYKAGVAVIRVSGPQALMALEQLSGLHAPVQRDMRYVLLSWGGKKIDQALAVYFKGPTSFTGEDTVEFHVHGGRAVIEGVYAALSHIPGLRAAEAGEFTKRAFENGKIDLTEAEAVADLIAAETEAQRLQALEQLGGSLSKLYKNWTDRLAKILAHQEADIEFPDEDMPSGISDTLQPEIQRLVQEISEHLDDNRRGERLRDGIRIAIIGAPNAGKSSLLNTLARRDAAIVSDEAGTTRDVIEVHLDLGGYPVIVSDTAGLRQTDNKIETEGIRRAGEAARDADIKVALFDSSLGTMDAETKKWVDDDTVVVFNKSDIAANNSDGGYNLSVKTGDGIDVFLKSLELKVSALFKNRSGPVLTRSRHRSDLNEAREFLTRSLAATLPELGAEDLRMALRSIGKITGRVHVEDLLDRIFRDFCIGK